MTRIFPRTLISRTSIQFGKTSYASGLIQAGRDSLDHVIPCPDGLAAPKARLPGAVLLEHHIHTTILHHGEQKIRAIIAVCQHQIARHEHLVSLPKQAVFARAFTLAGIQGRP